MRRIGIPRIGTNAAIADEVAEALREVREISSALRPHQLDYLGLKQALQALLRKVSQSSAIVYDFDFVDVDDLLSMDGQTNVYRIVQECLQNIVKHAEASHATVTVKRAARTVRIEVIDDGIGFTPASKPAGLGLTSIAERVQCLNGTLSIRSAPGSGVKVQIELRAAEERRNREFQLNGECGEPRSANQFTT